jgi:hypothetical protein
MLNKYFDNQEEPQLDEPKRTRYGQKVFDLVKGIDVEFKKKKKEEDGTMTRKNRKQDKMEKPHVTPYSFQEAVMFLQVPIILESARYAPCHRLHAPREECL